MMDWFEDEVRGLESAAREHAPHTGGVVFYGSSSIRLWHTLGADFPGRNVVNLGFGGSTLAACAHFFARLVPPLQPGSVVLYAGDNDLGDGRSPEDVLAAYRDLASQFRDALPHARLTFLSVKPSPARWHLEPIIVRANQLIAAEVVGSIQEHYLDVHTPMLSSDGRPRPELYSDDGLHLSPAGYRCWTEILGWAGWIF